MRWTSYESHDEDPLTDWSDDVSRVWPFLVDRFHMHKMIIKSHKIYPSHCGVST